VREKLRRANIACYFIEVNTEDFVEDRLLLDCKDPAVFQLSKSQLQRYRRAFDPKADPADYESFCQLGQFQRMDISHKLYMIARKEMNELARNLGGKNFPVASLRDAQAAFAQVAKEIGTQYSLGYYSTNQNRDGSFRTIRVELKGVKGASIRAREGYIAPKS
jgi:VWFA-related protein